MGVVVVLWSSLLSFVEVNPCLSFIVGGVACLAMLRVTCCGAVLLLCCCLLVLLFDVCAVVGVVCCLMRFMFVVRGWCCRRLQTCFVAVVCSCLVVKVVVVCRCCCVLCVVCCRCCMALVVVAGGA